MSQLDALSCGYTGFPSTEQRLGLYPVVDSLLWIERLLAAGVTTLQLRIKMQTMLRWSKILSRPLN